MKQNSYIDYYRRKYQTDERIVDIERELSEEVFVVKP